MTGLMQVNEVLSFPSWEWESAWCYFLTLFFYFSVTSISRCLNATDYFTRREEKNLESVLQSVGSHKPRAASYNPEQDRLAGGLENSPLRDQ